MWRDKKIKKTSKSDTSWIIFCIFERLKKKKKNASLYKNI